MSREEWKTTLSTGLMVAVIFGYMLLDFFLIGYQRGGMRGEEQQDQAPDPEAEAEGQAGVHIVGDRHCDHSGIVWRISVLCVPAF